MTEPMRDHPDIAAMERTGYPSWYQGRPAAVCSECGRDVRGEEAHLFGWQPTGAREPRKVCGGCYTKLVAEDYSPEELAYLLHAEVWEV